MDKFWQAVLKGLIEYLEKNPQVLQALIAALVEYFRKVIEDANKGTA